MTWINLLVCNPTTIISLILVLLVLYRIEISLILCFYICHLCRYIGRSGSISLGKCFSVIHCKLIHICFILCIELHNRSFFCCSGDIIFSRH